MSVTRVTLEGYPTIDCSGGKLGKLELPMYNEGGIKLEFQIEGAEEGPTGTAEGSAVNLPRFTYKPPSFSITSILDATGVMNKGFMIKETDTDFDQKTLFEPKFKTINKFISELKRITYNYVDSTHGPPYVKIYYGAILPDGTSPNDSVKSKTFIGRLTKLEVNYILISKTGEPVRAEITLDFEHVTDPAAAATGQSPDLTHYIDIKHGDSLPNLCKQIYSDPNLFMQIARINNLPSVNAIKPGMRLLFPPLDKASR